MNKVLCKSEIATRMNLSPRTLESDKGWHKVLIEYGMYNQSLGKRPSWRMRQQDLEVMLDALRLGRLRPQGQLAVN